MMSALFLRRLSSLAEVSQTTAADRERAFEDAKGFLPRIMQNVRQVGSNDASCTSGNFQHPGSLRQIQRKPRALRML